MIEYVLLQKSIENSRFEMFLFIELPKRDTEQRKRVEQHSGDVISTLVFNPLKRLRKFLKEDYIPNTRPEIGCSSLPGGNKFYDQVLKFYTSTNMTAREIHQLGLEEVARINQEMRIVLKDMGLKNLTMKQFGEHIRW